MFQCLSAVDYVHRYGFAHRDLKPENFLVKQLGSNDELRQDVLIKLADFGLAREMRNNKNPLTEYISTRWYRAPELLLMSGNYTQSIDIFALGCIMAEMYLSRPLFPSHTESGQLMTIMSVLGTPSIQDWPEGYANAKAKGITFPHMPKSQPLIELL